MSLLTKWVESLDYQYEILSTCTRHVSPRSTCDKCVTSCAEGAITIEDGKAEINTKKCTECGACMSACPVQGIAGIYPKRTIEENQLVVTGKNTPTVKELLILHKKGVTTIVAKTEEEQERWKEQIEQANIVLEKLNRNPFTFSTNLIKKEKSITRRELFSLWKSEGKAVLREATPAKWRFNQKDLDLPKYYPSYQFATVIIEREKCSLCEACTKLCPKNCFAIEEREFVINPQRCTDCKLCVDTCPEKAITVTKNISEVEVKTYSIFESECKTCGNKFETLDEKKEKCVPCTMRERFLKQ